MWHMCALIAMMVWSIIHQGWMTFARLLWACGIQTGLQLLSTGGILLPVHPALRACATCGPRTCPAPGAPQPLPLGRGWSSLTAAAWTWAPRPHTLTF